MDIFNKLKVLENKCAAMLVFALSLASLVYVVIDETFTIPDSFRTAPCRRLMDGMDRLKPNNYYDSRHLSIDLIDCYLSLDANITVGLEGDVIRRLTEKRELYLETLQ